MRIFIFIFFIIICTVIFLVVIYNLLNYKKSKKIDPEYINLEQEFKDEENEEHKDILDFKDGNIDFLQRLKFIGEILFDECAKNNNTIIYDYDSAYPRFFSYKSQEIILLVFEILRYLIDEFQNTIFNVEFKLLKTQNSQNNFCIKIISNKNFQDTSKLAYLKSILNQTKQTQNLHLINIKKILQLQKLELSCEEIKQSVIFSFYASTSTISLNHFNFKANNLEILIAQNNIEIFNSLTQLINKMGGKSKPCYDWISIKKHLQSSIYTPDIVFIQSEILKNLTNEMEFLKQISKDKKTKFVLIANNKKSLEILNKIDFNIMCLKLPYTYEDIYAIFELTKKLNKIKQKDGLDFI